VLDRGLALGGAEGGEVDVYPGGAVLPVGPERPAGLGGAQLEGRIREPALAQVLVREGLEQPDGPVPPGLRLSQGADTLVPDALPFPEDGTL
jgi:hypothetical protein